MNAPESRPNKKPRVRDKRLKSLDNQVKLTQKPRHRMRWQLQPLDYIEKQNRSQQGIVWKHRK